MPESVGPIIIHVEATVLKPSIYQKLKDFASRHSKSVVQISADTSACPVFKEEEQCPQMHSQDSDQAYIVKSRV